MKRWGDIALSAARAEVERLRAIVASQDRQLASYDAQVTEQAKWIERLRAELDAVPVAAIAHMVDDSLTVKDIAAIDAWVHGDNELQDGAE